jgi:hypothetical protein
MVKICKDENYQYKYIYNKIIIQMSYFENVYDYYALIGIMGYETDTPRSTENIESQSPFLVLDRYPI